MILGSRRSGLGSLGAQLGQAGSVRAGVAAAVERETVAHGPLLPPRPLVRRLDGVADLAIGGPTIAAIGRVRLVGRVSTLVAGPFVTADGQVTSEGGALLLMPPSAVTAHGSIVRVTPRVVPAPVSGVGRCDVAGPRLELIGSVAPPDDVVDRAWHDLQQATDEDEELLVYLGVFE